MLGVKRECIFTKTLSHFHVVSGFPPDVAELISNKFFTLDELNKAILTFPYKWLDKTNKPHIAPQSFLGRKTIGDNAHKTGAY